MSGGRKRRKRPMRLRYRHDRCALCGLPIRPDQRTANGRTVHEDCSNAMRWRKGERGDESEQQQG